MTPARRNVLLYGLLALSVAAAVWVSDADRDGTDAVAAPVSEQANKPRQDPAAKPAKEEPLALSLDKLERASMSVGEANPFMSKSWFVAPPAPPPPPAPQPTAPPLPFSYAGKLEIDAGHWVVYLVKGDQSFAVNKGETFDTVYRFDGIENGNLVIQYLPLSVKQLLPIGAES